MTMVEGNDAGGSNFIRDEKRSDGFWERSLISSFNGDLQKKKKNTRRRYEEEELQFESILD